MVRKWIILIFGAILATTLAAYLAMPVIGELITPGPLSKAHAELEDNCLSCHVPFLSGQQDNRCLSCHVDVAEDIERDEGFHGKSPRVARESCASCHSDHKGLGFDIAAFDEQKFDHRLTDFPLTGAHAELTCASCHKPSQAFRVAPTTCVACHKKDDTHDGRLGEKCEGCHTTSNWTQTRAFDHSITGFNLLGKHRAVTCEGCHANRRFEGTPTTCVACHRNDDIHEGSKGDKCESCHVATGWEFVNFDHSRDTRFPLTGSHRATTCVQCHGKGERIKRPPMTCFGCHAEDDVHKGSYGRDCASCHKTTTWSSVSFDHARFGFPLRGAHAAIACKTCHVQPAGKVKLPTTCAGCHSSDDPHRGQLGRTCASCHTESRWRPASGFDHDATAFRLAGRHRAVTCTACHANLTFQAKGTTCIACHADTRHAGRFGRAPNCAQCHDTSDWQSWTFDHGRQTSFPLDGRHARLSCYACHGQETQSARIGSTCSQCHSADDIHRGEFGSNCAECHTTGSWSELITRTSMVRRRRRFRKGKVS
ncbi:cytochrome C [Erythrobacter vulgaris]|uniref:Cytochrome C n=1 Tax=Qipengyuania vulgaris TaxID=291985 RepID=A0A844XNB1_9SPHN|nr:cytochrome C [Qipengyuania vulgaris]MXO47471.1 cytochrome C [Qipengyuania vulgaris]